MPLPRYGQGGDAAGDYANLLNIISSGWGNQVTPFDIGLSLGPQQVGQAFQQGWGQINEERQQARRAAMARAQREQAEAELQSKYAIASGGWQNQRDLAGLQAQSHRDALQSALQQALLKTGSQEKIAGMGQQTAYRGQDINERLGLGQQGVAMRGQDIQQNLGQAQNITAQRGQDIQQGLGQGQLGLGYEKLIQMAQQAEADRKLKGELGFGGIETTRRGQDIQQRLGELQNEAARRGMDIQERLGLGKLDVTRRGQDIGQQANEQERLLKERLGFAGIDTTRRGQDIGQQTSEQERLLREKLGLMGVDTTRRGQDIQQQLGLGQQGVAMRGQDIGLQGKKLGLQTAKEERLGQQAWKSGENKLERESRANLADITTTRQEGLMDKRQEQQNNLAYQKTLGDIMAPPLARAHAALNATTPGAESLKNAARMFSDPNNEGEFIQNLAIVHDWQQKGILQKKLTEAVDMFQKRQARIAQGLPPEEESSLTGWLFNAGVDAATMPLRWGYGAAKTMAPWLIPGF